MKEKKTSNTSIGSSNMPKKQHQLVLLDDDVNSFEDVINSLCEVLGHNVFQAEQCATIVHNKGECVVQYGDKEDLEFYQKVLESDGLNVKVETIN
jgi:ATP-dependent Clp protease adaptor protein ClpS